MVMLSDLTITCFASSLGTKFRSILCTATISRTLIWALSGPTYCGLAESTILSDEPGTTRVSQNSKSNCTAGDSKTQIDQVLWFSLHFYLTFALLLYTALFFLVGFACAHLFFHYNKQKRKNNLDYILNCKVEVKQLNDSQPFSSISLRFFFSAFF